MILTKAEYIVDKTSQKWYNKECLTALFMIVRKKILKGPEK